MADKRLDADALNWAVGLAGRGGAPLEVRGLRFGDSPWLIRFADREVILRVSDDAEAIETERAALEFVTTLGLPAPHVFGSRIGSEMSLLLTERIAGESRIPRTLPRERLRMLGAFAARLSSIPAPTGFERRTSPISGVDFAAMRRESAPRELFVQAEEAVAAYHPTGPDGFVHGDLWQGNVLWVGETISGVIDWDCAGIGSAGIDLGSLRAEAIETFGNGAEDVVLEGWEAEAGRPAADVAYWDLVTGLATPPDMGWFVGVTRAQGRPDLTRKSMIRRRDDLLRHALERI